jgi:hypothetical protein
VLINLAEFDGVRDVDDAVAEGQGAKVFIGVPLASTEVRRLLERAGHGHREAAARLVATRKRRNRKRRPA